MTIIYRLNIYYIYKSTLIYIIDNNDWNISNILWQTLKKKETGCNWN